ncbi:MAG: hypothetical protein Q7T83_01375, partial [Thermodesulfovibrionales bacterium]|nr:hypothetical protein [Thermodesulfovibrionales bacterium]
MRIQSREQRAEGREENTSGNYHVIGILLILFLIILFANYAHAVEYSLEDLYRIALERSERIKISEEDLFIAETGKDKARSV